jgi:hypothetical protein
MPLVNAWCGPPVLTDHWPLHPSLTKAKVASYALAGVDKSGSCRTARRKALDRMHCCVVHGDALPLCNLCLGFDFWSHDLCRDSAEVDGISN